MLVFIYIIIDQVQNNSWATTCLTEEQYLMTLKNQQRFVLSTWLSFIS
uniref:Uncharacterized protein n=1 Tax=Arundo donax TaxID=35708 RepID=A0A0A9CL54_ARUDO